jgi:hypothetical protein
VPNNFTDLELKGKAYRVGNDIKDVVTGANTTDQYSVVETKCHAYEWMTAYVGMIAVQRKQRSNFRNHTAAETAAPVVVCAVGRGPLDEFDWMFAGVVRSNSVRTVDDGMGPSVDEYFTLTVNADSTTSHCSLVSLSCTSNLSNQRVVCA